MNSGERERERERERARERKASSSPVQRSPANPELQFVPIARTSRSPVRAVDRDPRLQSREALRRSRSREASIGVTLREIAIGVVLRKISVARDLAKHRAVEPSRASIAISPLVELASRASIVDDFFFFLGFVRVFLGLSFPSSFPNTRKYFSEIFLKCNQTHENIFLSGK